MEGKSEKFGFIMFLLLLAFFFGGFGAGYALWHNDNNVSLAPVYALDCIVDTSKVGATSVCYPAGELSVFWKEATKSTQFTVNGEPVEITDITVNYRQQSMECFWFKYTSHENDWISYLEWLDKLNNEVNITHLGGTWENRCACYTKEGYEHGNITYYPLGIYDSQTYVVPKLDWQKGIENSQTYVAPMPTPTPYFERDCLVFSQDCETCLWRCTMYGWHRSDAPKIPMSYVECESCPILKFELGNVTRGFDYDN